MDVVFASGVLAEVQEACDYYENEVEGLARIFQRVLYDGIQTIKRHPTASRQIKPPYRRYLTPRFPYGIIYRHDSETLTIVAVAHLKRMPDYWEGRA